MLHVLAAGDGSVPWEQILNVGVGPVMVVLLFLSKRVWPDGAYQAQVLRADQEATRADRNEAKVDEMVSLFRTEVTPALVMAQSTITAAQRVIEKALDR